MKVNDLVVMLMFERQRQNISMYRLAKNAGMSSSKLSEYESGHHYPSLSSFVQWADALGFRVELVKYEEE